jgi:RNA polymerase sigma-70 factor (ECF subfamily)
LEKEFLDLIRVNQGIIHKVTGVYCDNEEDRKDLFQEILAQLWKSYPGFRHESKFSTWMYRIALNTAITSFKKWRRQPVSGASLSLASHQIADDSGSAETDENIALLKRAINRLTGIEKSIILLFLENKSYEEIADITGITQNYVRVKMNRIKTKLKGFMLSEE